MITVIVGTNRKKNLSKIVARYYQAELERFTNQEIRYFSLEDLPDGFIHEMMYEEAFQNADLADIQDQYFTPAQKLVFVIPEYNGSFPGIFKLFIDAISIRNYKENFEGKKVALIGVASGRGGNLRGLDHLTTSLNYLKMFIYPNRLPIGNIEGKIDKDSITDKELIKELANHAKAFSKF